MELGCLRDIEQDVCVGAWLRESGGRGGPGTGPVGIGPTAYWNPELPPWRWLPGTGAPVLPFTEPFMYTPRCHWVLITTPASPLYTPGSRDKGDIESLACGHLAGK